MTQSSSYILHILVPILFFTLIFSTAYYSYKAIKSKNQKHVRIASILIIFLLMCMGSFAFLHALIIGHYHPDISLIPSILIITICIVTIGYFSAVALKGRFIAWKIKIKKT
jgi:hypothetical protein